MFTEQNSSGYYNQGQLGYAGGNLTGQTAQQYDAPRAISSSALAPRVTQLEQQLAALRAEFAQCIETVCARIGKLNEAVGL